jgi:hypothetical protein
MIRTFAVSTLAFALLYGAANAQQSAPPAQAPQSTLPGAAKDDEACPPAVATGMATGMQMVQSMMGAMANVAKTTTSVAPPVSTPEQKKAQ